MTNVKVLRTETLHMTRNIRKSSAKKISFHDNQEYLQQKLARNIKS